MRLRTSHRSLLPACLCGLAAGGGAFGSRAVAQDALRYSLAGDQASAERKAAIESQAYNLRFGDVRFLLNSSLSLELNDNVAYSDLNRQEDLIISPMVGTAVYWPVSEKNVLNLSLGVGYRDYVVHSQYDVLLLTPGSEVSFDLFVKDFRFTFYDRFAYTQNTREEGAISGVANYDYFDNTAGLKAAWDLDKVILTAGYGHENWLSGTSTFDYLTRSAELFVSRAAFSLNRVTSAGLEATATVTTYEENVLNDNVGYSVGPFVDWKLTREFAVTARGGCVAYSFWGGVAEPPAKPSPYYFDVTLTHTSTKFFAHSLAAGHEIRQGVYSDLEELTFVRYQGNWRASKKLRVNPELFFEQGTYPFFVSTVTGGSRPSFTQGEHYDRYGAALSVSYPLKKKLDAQAAYRFTRKESDVLSREYNQNSLSLAATYHF